MPRNVKMLAWTQTIVNEGVATHTTNILQEIVKEWSYTVALISSRFIDKLLGQHYYVQSKDWPLEKPFQENSARQCQRSEWGHAQKRKEILQN